MVESASSGGRAGGGGRSGGGGELAVAVRWRWWRAGGGGGELAAVVESWQWWMVGDTFLTGFCLAGCGFHRFIFSLSGKEINAKGRWDRILTQVTFFNEVPCPPAWIACASWSAGPRGG